MNVPLQRLLRYDDWANDQVLRSLRAHPEAPDRAWRIFAHIVGVNDLFLTRVRGEPPPLVWPAPATVDFEASLARIAGAWAAVLAENSSFERPVTYVNSKGERWTSRLGDIVTHVAMHGSYHRGQIAMLLGGAGVEPPYTDYVQATRAGEIG